MSAITPVLIGGDLNAYNLARAFHEAYGVKSYLFGRYAVSATKYSGIVIPTYVSDIDDKTRLLSVLTDFAKAHKDENLILFGCTDDYVSLIIDLKSENALPDYKIPYASAHCRDIFADKADFYLMCEKYGIPYPKTLIIGSADELPCDLTQEGFAFPVVIKPSSSAAYWHHPFDGMRKVYFAKDQSDAERIVSDIFGSGYDKRIIIQEKIIGGDDGMRVVTTYSNGDAKVKMACLGHVLLEEHTPKGIGNHSAIITEYAPEVTSPLIRMLEGEGYTGFCNFDVKYDAASGRYLAFDMNLRQGRSNYYCTAAGANLAKCVVDDLVNGLEQPFFEVQKCVFWHNIPLGVVYSYTANPALAKLAKKLKKEGAEASSLRYTHDLLTRPLRLACVAVMMLRQYKKYKINS